MRWALLTTITLFCLGASSQEMAISDPQLIIQDQQKHIAEIENKVQQLENDAHIQQLYYQILLLRKDVKIKLVWQITLLVDKYAKIYKIDPDLVLALIRVESYFDPKAVSPKGAIGLTQVMPFHKKFPKENLFDIEANIDRGLNIFTGYLKQFNGDIGLALLAYNQGPETVAWYLKNKLDPSNGYELSVIRRYKQLKWYQTPLSNTKIVPPVIVASTHP